MKRACRVLLVLLLGWGRAAAGGLPEAGLFDHSALDGVLRAVVRGEGVDYPLVRRQHLAALDGYLRRAGAVELNSLPSNERLALLINVYNATVVRVVSERAEPGYTVERDAFRLFDEPLVELEGERISLNRLEHGIIRPRFRDARIHVALVCAARSCPPLLPRAYRADDLDRVLEANMVRFVHDPSRNRIDASSRRLELSKLFEWYAEDFGGIENLARYVDRHTESDVLGFEIAFRDYSWELNVAPEARP